MDKRRFNQLIFIITLMVMSAAALRAHDHNIFKAQDWLVQDKSAQLEILSLPYAETPDSFADDSHKSLYQIGEALFRAPTLLGGQAAKARISCNSCHLNGADNPYFLFPNISGDPGTADASNSFFSSFRGNQNFDPVKIPDLRKIGKISHAPNTQELRNFIRGLIVEEFNGQEPSDSTLDALTFYVKSLKNTNLNKPHKGKTLSVEDPLVIINQSIENIKTSLRNKDLDVAVLLIASARNQLGLIYERYQGSELKPIRDHIISSSNSLARIKDAWLVDKPELTNFEAWEKWQENFTSLETMLYHNEEASLYNIKKLQKSFKKH